MPRGGLHEWHKLSAHIGRFFNARKEVKGWQNGQLYEAKEHLQAWLDADLALATGKEYTIGNRRLTRANVQEVKRPYQLLA